MTEAASDNDEKEKQPQVQAGGDGARSGGRGTRNGAPEGHRAGGSGQYKRGQSVTCKVGLAQYADGYSVTVLETGDFGFLKTAAKLSQGEEIPAVFNCWSPKAHYDQCWKFPLLSLPPTAQKKASVLDFVAWVLQKLKELVGWPWYGKQPEQGGGPQ